MNEYQEFIGRKVNMTVAEQKIKIGETDYDYKSYQLDDPVAEAEMKAVASVVRIFMPGEMGTCDSRTGRVNFYINENGIIIDVDMG